MIDPKDFGDSQQEFVRKKICFVINELPVNMDGALNGAMAQTLSLAKGFRDHGYEVFIVTGSKKKVPGNCADYIEGINSIKWFKPRIFDFASYCSVLKTLVDLKADVYYTRGRSYLVAVIFSASSRVNAISVWSSTGHEGCRKFHQVKKIIRKKRSIIWKALVLPVAFIEDLITQRGISKVNIALSQTKDQLIDLEHYYKRVGIVFKSGHYRSVSPSDKAYPPLVLFLSHLIPVKQPELFIELARSLKNHNCKFIMAGNIDKAIEKTLRERVQSCFNLEYLGHISFEESIKLIARSSVLVNTAKIEGEGLSNSMILAWLHSTPVVSLESDPDDIIKKNNLGFHSGSFTQLVEDVRFLITNDEKRNQLGQICKEYAETNFDISRIVRDLERLIIRFKSDILQ